MKLSSTAIDAVIKGGPGGGLGEVGADYQPWGARGLGGREIKIAPADSAGTSTFR